MQKTINTSVKISPALYDRLHQLAVARRTSRHAIMRQALEAFVAREEQREALRQAGSEAWEDYQATGLHLTNAEVTDWLEKLIQGEDVPMPKCHP